jgi:type II secretory pathway component GspD/PulD (secretin)
LQIVKASAAAKIVHGLYPHAVIRVDAAANALIVVASEDDQTAIRTIVAGIDVRNPTAETVEAISLHESKPSDVAKRLRPLFPRAHFAAAPNQTLIVSATAQDAAQSARSLRHSILQRRSRHRDPSVRRWSSG